MRRARTKLLDRSRHDRDARVFVVATEGTQTEPQYFRGLQARDVVDRSRVHIEVIPTPADGTSAPHHVLARLDEVARRHAFLPFDERWLVFDVDHREPAELTEVATGALQRGFSLAVSRPGFEVWLQLHLGENDLAPTCSSKDCVDTLRSALGGSYAKANLPEVFLERERVEAATTRARAVDTTPGDRWPQATGTHVHRLVERLLAAARRA